MVTHLRNFRFIRNTAVLAAVLLLVPSAYANSKKDAFHDAMRKLWEDHVTWTRLYIVDAVAGSPGKDLTAKRLLDNQTDIGNAVAEYYGRDAGNKLTALLRDHILIAHRAAGLDDGGGAGTSDFLHAIGKRKERV